MKQTSDKENHYIFSRAFKSLKPLSNAIKIPSNSPNVALVHPVTKSSNGIDLHIVPTRVAPPPPIVKNGDVLSKVEKFNLNAPSPPKLPPMNKNSTARPLISNPVLEASTSDAKEVPQVVKYPTLRPAPAAPRSVAFNDKIVPEILINPTSDKKPKDGTLSRIQSFLKKDTTPKVEKVHKQLKVIDKEKLKGLEISSPILIGSHDDLQTIDKKEEIDKRAKVKRAQSMRDPPSPPVAKPFNPAGSMRQPRPKSIVERPSIPPPRPPAPAQIVRQASVEQFSSFDSFESRTPGTPERDNIYSVIDEKQVTPPTLMSPPGPHNQKGSIESVGLLSEIVNEIEHRNFDSIYIASDMKRKKAAEEPKYENGNEEIYNGDAESTTSSGYMRPINNTPIARIPPTNKLPSSNSSNSMSSFKSAKSGNSVETLKSPLEKTLKFDGPMKKSFSDSAKKISEENTYKTPTSNKPLFDDKKSVLKKATTTPAISSTKQPTSVRNRSPSPTKSATSKPKLSQKPSLSSKNPANKALNSAASKKSTVAALQQKFESSKS